MSDNPRIVIRAAITGPTQVFLNGNEVPNVINWMAYKKIDEEFPTVILEMKVGSVQVDVDVPVLYLEREKKDGVQSSPSPSTGQGGSVAEGT